MYGFLTFAYRLLLVAGLGLMAMAGLVSLGYMRAVATFGSFVQDRSDAFASDAFSQSLLLLFFAFVAYRVRRKLRLDERFRDEREAPTDAALRP